MKRRRYRNPPGLVIAYMQARLPTNRARSLILRQRAIIQGFAQKYGVLIHMWYARAKDSQPRPTPEELIEAGLVYCIVAANWDKLNGCEEGADFSYYHEGSVFFPGWRVPGPKRPDWKWTFDHQLMDRG